MSGGVVEAPVASRFRRAELVGFGLLAYVPFFLSAPGKISADTKAYLYLDPGRLLSRAVYLWDSHVGTGTVPHQNIGYLFPMGPYYWLMDKLGLPDWVAQRIWLGSISFAAALGVLWLLRMLGIRRAGTIAGALVYMLTPYQVALTARLSVILLPWAALPWLVGLTVRALQRGGWREPALFALVALTAGSVSAPSLLLVGIAPVLWLVFAVVDRRATARAALAAAGRIGVLSAGVSIWWATGLVTQARYGIPILNVTESLQTVARSSNPADILRGLGNWFLSGADRVGPWLDQSHGYAQTWLAVVTFAVPALALVAAATVRWRNRGYFVALVVIGTIVGVGAWPYDDPSPIGSLFKHAASGSAFGLALRNTPRVVPIVVLGLAALLAAGVSALAARPRYELLSAGAIGLIVVVGFAPVWQHGYLSKHLERPEHIPSYWNAAASTLDRDHSGTRVLEIPGSLFAAYRWGNTVDPITPGLIDRPWVARELLPFGSRASVDLLAALDRRMQEGTLEPQTVAVIARLMRAGTLVVRSDLQYERYESPQPRLLWAELTDPLAPGLGTPRAFGPQRRNLADPAIVANDPHEAATASLPDPPAVALVPVKGAHPIVDTAPQQHPVVLAGSGDGIVDAAAAGLLDGNELILYSASLTQAQLEDALKHGADLVVTDSNRRRAKRWNYLKDDTGFTERSGQHALREDTDDYRLDPFAGKGDGERTVAEQRHAEVDATSYGFTGRYWPDDRPVNAFDGDPTTAWRAAGGLDPAGEQIVVRLDRAVRTDHLRLVQPLDAPNARWLTKVRLHFDQGQDVTVDLDKSSRTANGQTVRFGPRTVKRVQIDLLAASPGFDPVGFAEIGIGRVHADEVVRVPTALLQHAGSRSLDHRLVFVFTRLRYDPLASNRHDEEPALIRSFDLPTARRFSILATAHGTVNVPRTQCFDSLIQIDGRPLRVQVGESAPGTTTLVSCDGLVVLNAGSHVIRAAPAPNAGITLDRIVLTSARGGGAATKPVARLGGSASASGAHVRVVDSGPTSYDLKVTTDGKPFWLVLGQSDNAGWHAERSDGTSLGTPRLVDGYANGWQVDLKQPGTLLIHLRWTPQNVVWVGIAVSLLAVLVCVVLLVRRRRMSALALTDADTPMLTTPFSYSAFDQRRDLRTTVVAAAIAGVGAAAVSRLWIGALVAVGVVIAMHVHRGRIVLTAGAPAALALAKIASKPELGWLAITLLAADLLVSFVASRQAGTDVISADNASRSAKDGTPQPAS